MAIGAKIVVAAVNLICLFVTLIYPNDAMYIKVEENVELEWLEDNKVLVKYPQGIKSVTPGQACVFYDKDECLGGGIIKEVRKNNEKLWYL